MKDGKNVVDSPPTESYVKVVVKFRDVCKKFPKFFDYVDSKILKKKIMRKLIGRVLILDNKTTKIVESAHGMLKKYLKNCKGDLARGLEVIHNMLVL